MAIGRSVPMLDSLARVTGTVPYATNLELPDMLVAKVLRSPFPHARILGIDAAAAERTPGVAAVMTASDFSQPGAPALLYGVILRDQPVLAKDRVRFAGEPVALVAAENIQVAEAALALIDIEYQELPAVYHASDALQPDAPLLHERFPNNRFVHAKLRHGDLEAGFAEADEIIEETFTSPAAQQTSLEPHATVAQWVDGKLTVWSATQAPYIVRRVLAAIFDLPPEAVRVIVPPLGGGFGGKGHVRIEPMVAALAWKVAGRPVKLRLTRSEESATVTKHAAMITHRTGVKRDGTLTARQTTIYWNGGAYADISPALARGGMVRSIGPYNIPAVSVDSYCIYTNLPPAAAYRGAMSSQCAWAYESHMDTIAFRLGIDPLEIRLKNILHSGDHFCTGEILHDVHFAECLSAAAKGIGWREPECKNDAGPLRHGLGLGVMMKSTIASSRSECRLVMNDHGEVALFTSTVEMGQGTHTALAQIAAEATGIPLEKVSLHGPDTLVTPFDSTTSASRSVSMMGNAVLNAAEALKQELIKYAAPVLQAPVEELSARQGHVFMRRHPETGVPYAYILQQSNVDELEAKGAFETKGGLDPETGQGIASPHWHQGAGACKVEIDRETGAVRVLRYCAASYAGRVINPALAKLQNDGNVVFGLGPALLEEMVIEDGQVINTNLSDYMIPSFLDAPIELKSIALEKEGGEFHGIGEMTLPPVAPAIANAIFDAIGVRIRDLPITAEKVLRAIANEKP